MREPSEEEIAEYAASRTPEEECQWKVPDEEEECQCIYVDVDVVDARGCPAHGPRSSLARRLREQEAADEAAYWSGWKPESGS